MMINDEIFAHFSYRSFLSIFDSFVIQAIKVCEHVAEHYGRILFWKSRNAT